MDLELKSRLERWTSLHSVLMLAACSISIFVSSPLPISALAVLSFCYLWWSQAGFLNQYLRFAGGANRITAIRLALVAFAIVMTDQLSTMVFFLLMLVAVVLDVCDGWWARKYNQQSQFGSVFDMEADAFFVLCMGAYFYFTLGYELWVFIPGLLRYAYRLVHDLVAPPHYIEKKKRYAATLAGMNFVLLLIAIMLPEPFKFWIVWISLISVVFSFSRSFWELYAYEAR